jgi:hypothetical protein
MNWTAVSLAALGGLVILGPTQIVAWLVAGDGAAPAWSILYLVIGVVSFTVAGAIAGWNQTEAPISYGAAAACGTYLVVAAVSAGRQAATGEPIAWLGIPAMVLLACSCGAAGGLLAEWAYRRRRRPGTMSSLGEPAG